jgi:mycothiol synthase
VLFQMRRSLFAALPQAPLPDGVRLRAYQPGVDDEAWLELNARAFANHPEQGKWTLADLRVRLAEPWFDREGFILADRDGQLVGFHWTKIHGGDHGDHHHDPIGEVYVLGVDPAAHARGLGAALTVEGLAHLRRRGLDQVMLYVDGTNEPAIRLYAKLGFVRWTTDVAFAREGIDRS